jgi:hypothetical protein
VKIGDEEKEKENTKKKEKNPKNVQGPALMKPARKKDHLNVEPKKNDSLNS